MEKIREGKMSDRAARVIALAVKRKVINKGKEARNAQDIESKISIKMKTITFKLIHICNLKMGGMNIY